MSRRDAHGPYHRHGSNVPRQAPGEAEPGQATPGSASERPAGYGMANYGRIFRSRRAGDDPPNMAMDAFGGTGSAPWGLSGSAVWHLERRDRHTAAHLPRSLPGPSAISCLYMRGVRVSRTPGKLQGFHALGVSALVDCLPASDRRYYPLYAMAAEPASRCAFIRR